MNRSLIMLFHNKCINVNQCLWIFLWRGGAIPKIKINRKLILLICDNKRSYAVSFRGNVVFFVSSQRQSSQKKKIFELLNEFSEFQFQDDRWRDKSLTNVLLVKIIRIISQESILFSCPFCFYFLLPIFVHYCWRRKWLFQYKVIILRIVWKTFIVIRS